MARILVAGPQAGALERAFLAKIVERLRSTGQDASLVNEADAKTVRDADAVVAWLDGARPDPAATALAAYASALGKPTLGLRSEDVGHKPLDPFLQTVFQRIHQSAEPNGLLDGLIQFAEEVRPFAGRLVRDEIPKLVKEAGHHVTFRQVPKEDRPRFLKEKVAKEAQELAKADLASEKEEVADILEALEAFIRSRNYERDGLRMVKEAKLRRRGGFERCFVVESTSDTPPESVPATPATGAQAQRPGDKGATTSPIPRDPGATTSPNSRDQAASNPISRDQEPPARRFAKPASRWNHKVEPAPEPLQETSLDQGGFDYIEKPQEGFEYDDSQPFDPQAPRAPGAKRDVEPTLRDL